MFTDTAISIENIDEVEVRKYGRMFEPGEVKDIPVEELIAYSLMEQSLALQYISRRMGKITKILEREEFRQSNSSAATEIRVTNAHEFKQDPWLVKKYHAWKSKRAWKARRRTETKS